MGETTSDSSTSIDSEIYECLEGLRSLAENITKGSFNVEGIYECTLRAAIGKCFEYSELVQAKTVESSAFFLTPTLRGICEDLIVLTFIKQLEGNDRDSVINSLVDLNLQKSVTSQGEFFKSRRPWQPVVTRSANTISRSEVELREFSKKLGWNDQRRIWPSLWYMAKNTSYEEVYKYLYSATSRLVHFSPHVLLRMGWGGDKNSGVDSDTVWSFKTNHFNQYYVEFNRIYSILLLIELLEGPGNDLLADTDKELVKNLSESLEKVLRWPEIVTFEELNIQSPSNFIRITARVMHESGVDLSQLPNAEEEGV